MTGPTDPLDAMTRPGDPLDGTTDDPESEPTSTEASALPAGPLGLADVAEASRAVAETSARTAKSAALGALLVRAAPEEIAPVVAWLCGDLTQRRIGVGWGSLKAPPAPAAEPTLTVLEVERAFTALATMTGAGSQAARGAAVEALFAAATEREQAFLLTLLGGGLRQGALAAVMTDAVGKAAGVPATVVRRALTLNGDLGTVARLALTGGRAALEAVTLTVGLPLSPMLAGTAPEVAEAFTAGAAAAVDWKVDGTRVQIHRDGDTVHAFTRSLDDVTTRLPDVVAFALGLDATSFVMDAEAIALRADGRPEPFQVTAARFSTAGARELPLTVLAFDLLHRDGEDLLDLPLRDRIASLATLVPDSARVPSKLCATAEEAQVVFDEAVAAGYEGVVVKAVDGPYAAGRRGAGWVKVKPVHTLDLVVLAAEWGHGRRQGKLSNLHLGARDGDGFAMIGKTFKGLTDELLAWQTEALLALKTEQTGITVHVRPELVVEIAIDGVQTSTRYASGAALRFARVRRYREDKAAEAADTLELVLRMRDGDASSGDGEA